MNEEANVQRRGAGRAGKLLASAALIVLGNAIYAAGVVLFILPSGLITGGTTGIALIVNHFTGMQISAFVGAFNVAMFALGYLVLGRKFAMSTLVSTFSYPVMLGLIQKAVGDFVLTEDLLLSALFGGLLIGLALAVVIRLGASTGGMDIAFLVMSEALKDAGENVIVFGSIVLVMQGVIGFPIASFLCKKEAMRLRTAFRNGTLVALDDTTVAEGTSAKKTLIPQIPEK